MADGDKWSTNANEAIKIRFFPPTGSSVKKDTIFSPDFTHALFGEEETIFGYDKLKIWLDFDSDTLRPDLQVVHNGQVEQVGDTKADEPEEVLRELMPGLALSDEDNQKSGQSFTPPGKKVTEYTANGDRYGIWAANLLDPAAKRLLRSMQILVLLFIDGASMIELDDPDWTIQRWTVFFVYKIEPTQDSQTCYHFIGYSTVYRLFFLDRDAQQTPLTDLPPEDHDLIHHLPARERISQFLILPPYHSAGHGSHLYNAMVNLFLANPQIRQITVEDPNEKFDDLRDFNDLARLRHTSAEFRALTLNTSATIAMQRDKPLPVAQLISSEIYDSISHTSRIAPRQFARLVEMQLLSAIPQNHRKTSRITRKDRATDLNDRAYYFWRLIVKQRLFMHNMDQLIQLEVEERVEKLEETVAVVEMDYARILEVVGNRAQRIAALGGGAGDMFDGVQKDVVDVDMDDAQDDQSLHAEQIGPGSDAKRLPSRMKRKRVLDDEDDEDGGMVVETEKKQKPVSSLDAVRAVSATETPRSGKKKRSKMPEVIDLE